jgi:hypothetical protein
MHPPSAGRYLAPSPPLRPITGEGACSVRHPGTTARSGTPPPRGDGGSETVPASETRVARRAILRASSWEDRARREENAWAREWADGPARVVRTTIPAGGRRKWLGIPSRKADRERRADLFEVTSECLRPVRRRALAAQTRFAGSWPSTRRKRDLARGRSWPAHGRFLGDLHRQAFCLPARGSRLICAPCLGKGASRDKAHAWRRFPRVPPRRQVDWRASPIRRALAVDKNCGRGCGGHAVRPGVEVWQRCRSGRANGGAPRGGRRHAVADGAAGNGIRCGRPGEGFT